MHLLLIRQLYDKIDRVLLWGKLLKMGINGSLFKLVFNMYSCRETICL